MGTLLKQGPSNNLPDCLSLDIDLDAKRASKIRKQDRTLVLRVTAHFHEQTLKHSLGSFVVALTGGDLRLDLKDVSLVRHTEFARFQRHKSKKSSRSSTSLRKTGAEHVSKPAGTAELGTGGAKISAGSSSEKKRTAAAEAAEGSVDEFTSDDYQLYALGGPRPGWRFRKKGTDPYLEGSFVGEEFGTCALSGKSGRIEARFEVEQRFIWMKVLDGVLLSKGIYPLQNPRKMKIANFLLWKYVIKPKTEPFLSYVALSYE